MGFVICDVADEGLDRALEDGVEIQGVEFTSDARIRQKLSRIFSFPQTAPQELWGT